MIRFLPLFLVLSAILSLPVRADQKSGKTSATQPADPSRLFATAVRPFLNTHCTQCHGKSKPKAGLNLAALEDETKALASRRVWTKVKENVEGSLMPPEGRPQPSRGEMEAVSKWIDSALNQADCGRSVDPGRVTIRRLNRTEYNNTLRDLAGVDFRPAEDFPSDDVGYGFDNIGDVLTIPPILLEKYLAAAEQIAARAIVADAIRGANTASLPESHRRIVFRTPNKPEEYQECAQAVVERFASRAYRRPVRGGELAKLLRFVDLARENGDRFERGVQLAVEAALVSPQFLFRVELNRGRKKAKPKDGKPSAEGLGVPLTDYEVASRLSYFLWSSMPDDELFQLAAEGKLQIEENLTRQVERMLRDTKASALVENFAGQWLQLRNLKTASPDKTLFPTFDEALRQAMRQESEQFFAAVVRDDKSILDFIDCDYTYLNERLATHYGIPGVSGDTFRRVRLDGRRRGGLITQASVLTVTSNPTRTSPVKRGRWVLEQILGTPPPPPPPNVPQLADDKKAILSGTLRQRMEQHRSNTSCANCHSRLDPPGFGLENFDAIGAWREKEGAFRIDASGKLPGGESFQGPGELKAILKGRPREFTRCLTEKLLTYALGRGLEDFDACTVDKITSAVAAGHYRFHRLVIEIVKSDPFLKRRG
jgi:mono/diheme cytochrome c family protein